VGGKLCDTPGQSRREVDEAVLGLGEPERHSKAANAMQAREPPIVTLGEVVEQCLEPLLQHLGLESAETQDQARLWYCSIDFDARRTAEGCQDIIG
jgi:hypothetical protein